MGSKHLVTLSVQTTTPEEWQDVWAAFNEYAAKLSKNKSKSQISISSVQLDEDPREKAEE